MHVKRFALGLTALVLASFGYVAQPHAAVSFNVGVCDPKTSANCIKPNSDGSINIVGSISASSPFKVLGNATISMSNVSARVALPTADTTVFIYNGSTTSNAFVKFGNGSVTAAATDQVIAPGSFIALSNAASNADIAGILASGTGTLYISTGTGSPFAAGGGGGGSGGGAITAAASSFATGFSSDVGTLATSAVCSTDTGACDLLGLVKRTNARITSLIGVQGTGSYYDPPTGGSALLGYMSGLYGIANDPTLISLVTPKAATTMGATPVAITSAASTNATNVKASAGALLGGQVINTTTTGYCIRFYNLSSAPTASSSTGYVFSIPIPPGAASGQYGGTLITPGTFGADFTTGLGYVITGGCTSTDNTNAAVGIYGFLTYK